MHIPDALLSAPVAATTGVVALAGLGLGLHRLSRRLGERATVLMGMMSAFLFAAQMVNFPVGPGVSGHLLGGVLAAVLLGPWAGATCIAAVLIVQCLLFADGGLTALGANFVNMGLIGSAFAYVIYVPIRRAIGGQAGVLIGAMAASWFSVTLSAGAAAIELAASGRASQWPMLLGWMALVHAVIGAGEAILTGLVLRFVLLTRPDLVPDPDADARSPKLAQIGQLTLAGLGLALAVAVFVSPLASEKPDGLEFVLNRLRIEAPEQAPLVRAPFPDYQAVAPSFGPLPVATAMAGMIGTVVVFGFGLGLARTLTVRSKGMAPDAA